MKSPVSISKCNRLYSFNNRTAFLTYLKFEDEGATVLLFKECLSKETAQQWVMLRASVRRNSQSRAKEFPLLTDSAFVVCSALRCYLRPAAAWPITDQCPHVSQKDNCDIIIPSQGGHSHRSAMDHLMTRDLSRTFLPL